MRKNTAANATNNIATSSEPHILSLDELKTQLPNDLRHYLALQYEGLYNDTATKIMTDDAQQSQSVPSKSAFAHLDRILDAMKYPPSTMTCRVNLILSSVEKVMEEVKDLLSTWSQPAPAGSTINQKEKRIPLFRVSRHDVLEDVIEIFVDKNLINTSLSHCTIPPNHLGSSSPTDSNISTNNNGAFFSKNWPSREQKKWPHSHRVVICDIMCGEAVLRGSNIFVKGILAADSGIIRGETVAVYADLKHKSDKVVTRGLLLEKYTGHCVFLGIGTTHCNRAEMFSQNHGLGVEMSICNTNDADNEAVGRAILSTRAGPILPPLNGVLVGKMMLQNLPSTLVAHALDPRPKDTILDMCAAPGGKTTHVASLVHNDALILACDKSRKKVRCMRDFFQSMGATCIVPLALDSTKCLVENNCDKSWKHVDELIRSATPSKKDGLLNVYSFHPESFDRILLDPPCSALGLRPKLCIDARNVSDVIKHATYQRKFVENAISLLKPGGIMTYSTCTFNSGENEEMVRYILDEFPCMELLPIDYNVGLPGLPLLSGGLTDDERGKVRRFDPSDNEIDSMGFFVAKLRKIRKEVIG